MGRRDVKGTKQFNYEITAELAEEFRSFCKGRGESVRDHLELALRRHLDNPPPPLKPVAPPLPPVTSPAPAGGATESTAKPKPAKKGKKK